MKKRTLAAAGIAALMPLVAVNAGAAERWTCNVFTGPKHFINKALKPWGKQVREVTEGEVKVNFLPTSAAPPPKQIDGIVAGTYDCAFIFHAFTAKRAIGPQFGILPFISRANAERGSIAFWRTWNKHFGAKKEFEDDGIKVLSMYHFPGVHFWTVEGQADRLDRRLEEPEDVGARRNLLAHHEGGRRRPRVRPRRPAGRVHPDQGGPGSRRHHKGLGSSTSPASSFAKSGTFTSKTMMAPSFAWMVSKKRWDALSPALRKADHVGLRREARPRRGCRGRQVRDRRRQEARQGRGGRGQGQRSSSRPRFRRRRSRRSAHGSSGPRPSASTAPRVLADFDKIVGDLGS